ncbi:MAG: DUF427 domain-containing protein [Marinovum sp.]|nr:DUF427 domain-containing protein [Marinovum sp.]
MIEVVPENVQNYPRPPALEPCSHVLRVDFGRETIVETSNAWRVLETHHAPTYYIPADTVRAKLIAAPGRSMCEWKGQACYWDIVVGEHRAARAAWSYAHPTSRFAPIANHLAIYAHKMDACFVAGERVQPQPGDFYGGWVTSNLCGHVKGARGTEHW